MMSTITLVTYYLPFQHKCRSMSPYWPSHNKFTIFTSTQSNYCIHFADKYSSSSHYYKSHHKFIIPIDTLSQYGRHVEDKYFFLNTSFVIIWEMNNSLSAEFNYRISFEIKFVWLIVSLSITSQTNYFQERPIHICCLLERHVCIWSWEHSKSHHKSIITTILSFNNGVHFAGKCIAFSSH